MIVALDGPAGAGKSTLASLIAQKMGYQLIETGALYRAVGYLAREKGVDLDNEISLAGIATLLNIRFEFQEGKNRVFVHGIELTQRLRTPQAAKDASVVSVLPAVRHALLDVQRTLAHASDSVMEGRDIGTVVCPDAEVKFFVTASSHVRAQRRLLELQRAGESPDFDQVLADIQTRDKRDSERDVAPLKAANDAIHIDTTHRDIDDVLNQMVENIERRVKLSV